MYLPPLQPVVKSDICVCGDVEIHPTASIAPGVILQAAPGSRILIGADVCLGMGVILHAYEGLIEIESGVTLGSGVLVIGTSKIGTNTCVGTATTIFQASIPAMTVITPGSIVGDKSRSWQQEQETQTENHPDILESHSKTSPSSLKVKKPVNQDDTTTPELGILNKEEKIKNNGSVEVTDFDPWETETMTETMSDISSNISLDPQEKETSISQGVAIGKVYIDQLLVTLFPHKNSLNNNSDKHSKSN